jgi:hypothetical protein
MPVMKWGELRAKASPTIRAILRALLSIYVGGLLVLIYLHFRVRPPVAEIETLWRYSGVPFYLLCFLIVATAPRENRQPIQSDVSPKWSGTYVVVATGLAGAIYLGWGATSVLQLGLPLLVVLITLAAATWVFRFASKNADQIGEARFPTR